MDKDEVRLLVYGAAQHEMQKNLGFGDGSRRKRAIIESVCLNCGEPVVDEKTREFEYLNTGICSHCQRAAVAEISDDDIADILLAKIWGESRMDFLISELGNRMGVVLMDRRARMRM